MMRITRAVVPSLFTVLNMFCGFMAIIHISRGEFISASWLIILAAGFDALDGVMARITKSSSEFGVEIDSLSDIISFGAAPAFLAYNVELFKLGGPGILISSLLMIFGGLRLARFNTQLVGFDKDHFIGLPIPVSALTVASFVLNFWGDVRGLGTAGTLLTPLVILLSLLMVSKVRYDTLPRISRKALRKEPWKYIFMGLAIIVVFVTAGSAILPLFLLFIVIGLVRYFGILLRKLTHQATGAEEEEPSDRTQIDM
jgi:CDP-diacylglycerol--serine O-phosphatidyltransferase